MRINRVILTLSCAIIVGTAGSSGATNLSDKAAQMQPGTWAELSTTGFSGSLLENGCIGNILGYSDSAMWDPIARQLRFMGSPHCGGAGGNPYKLIRYDDSSSAWTSCTGNDSSCAASFITDQGHAYEHSALDPGSQTWYRRWYGSARVSKFSFGTNGPWSDLPSMNHGYTQVAGGLAYFPELYGGGGLVFAQGGYGEVHLWNKSQNQWNKVATGLAMGPYHNFAEYNPVHKVVIFGGGNGSSDLYKVNASGAVTKMQNAPIGLGIQQTIITVDPISGDFLVLASGGKFYVYRVTTDTWTLQSGTPPVSSPLTSSLTDIIATPISNYGVTMFLRYNYTSSKVYLYRHSAGSGSTPPPPSPADTTAPVISSVQPTNVSSSSVSVTWTTDEASDTQVEYGLTASYGLLTGLDTVLVTNHARTLTGLTPSTLYHYRTKSKDAAGNLATSGDLTFTTSAQSAPPPSGTTFSQKCAQPGVLNCFAFDSPSELLYTWESPSSCDSALAGKTKYPWYGDRRAGSANTAATTGNAAGACYFPEIDNANRRSGTGSLKFTIPSNSGANSSGWFAEIFKRNPDGSSGYIAPGSPLGAVVYWQFYQYVDSNFLTTPYKCGTDGTETCGGWKQGIFYGNAPNGSSASSIEVTHNNGWLRGVPTMYGQIGQDDYGIQEAIGCSYNFNGQNTYPEPPCKRYKANQWMEFTVRVEVRGTPNAPQSRVQMWVDGQLAIDNSQAKINWGSSDGNGLGQFQLTPYHTRKYSGQAHPVGYTWMDDLIISTQPIPMSNGSTPGGGDTTPPAAPSNLTLN